MPFDGDGRKKAAKADGEIGQNGDEWEAQGEVMADG